VARCDVIDRRPPPKPWRFWMIATLNTPLAPASTNLNSLTTVTRSEGLTVTWTPGGAGLVRIWGNSVRSVGGISLANAFACAAPAGDGRFTVPSYVLKMLPAGTGAVKVGFYPNPQPFSAPGLDVGVASIDPLPVAPVTVTFQ
jgi:hypothetical protein